jgi:hypothetical protein
VLYLPKVIMKTSMAGVNHSYQYGEEVEVTDEVAQAWVEAEIAERVEVAPKKKPTLKKGEK